MWRGTTAACQLFSCVPRCGHMLQATMTASMAPADMTSEPAFHASAAGPMGLRPLIMGEANRGHRRPSFKCTHGEELEAASHRCSHAVSGRSGGPRHQPPACASSNLHRCGHSRRCRSRQDRGFGLDTRLRIGHVQPPHSSHPDRISRSWLPLSVARAGTWHMSCAPRAGYSARVLLELSRSVRFFYVHSSPRRAVARGRDLVRIGP